ncbi:MAG: hypothetical protein ACC645_20810 [Pirellulales bacterium]
MDAVQARQPARSRRQGWKLAGDRVRRPGHHHHARHHGRPGEFRAEFKELLAAEIEGVVDDWKTKRPWFVRTNNAITNTRSWPGIPSGPFTTFNRAE